MPRLRGFEENGGNKTMGNKSSYRETDLKQAEIDALKKELETKQKELNKLKEGEINSITDYFFESPASWFVLIGSAFVLFFLFSVKLHVKVWFSIIATLASLTTIASALYMTRFGLKKTKETKS